MNEKERKKERERERGREDGRKEKTQCCWAKKNGFVNYYW